MKQIIIILVIGFFAQALVAQDNQPKFKWHAIQLEGNINTFSRVHDIQGGNLTFTAIAAYAKNRVVLSSTKGETISIGYNVVEYNEIALSSGHEIMSFKDISLEAYARKLTLDFNLSHNWNPMELLDLDLGYTSRPVENDLPWLKKHGKS